MTGKARVLPTAIGVAVVAGWSMISCSSSPAEDRARLRALEDDPYAHVELGTEVMATKAEAGFEGKTIDGRVFQESSQWSRAVRSEDPKADARVAVAAMVGAGWDVTRVRCGNPANTWAPNTIRVDARKDFDGFVGSAVLSADPDHGEVKMFLSAPYSARSAASSNDREVLEEVPEACAQLLGLAAGAPPGCARWCRPADGAGTVPASPPTSHR